METDEKSIKDIKFGEFNTIKTEIKQEYDLETSNPEGLGTDPFLVDVKQLKAEPDEFGPEDVSSYFINANDLKELGVIKPENKPDDKIWGQTGKIAKGRKRLTSTVCPYCDRQFVTSKNFRKHVTGHTAERKFQCALCNSAFKEKYNLVIHIKTHRGERDIPCPMCDKVFIVRSALRSHMRTHSKEKPYLCNVCGKSFSHRANLKPHLATHNEGNLFECEICGECIRDRKGLLRHTKLHHIDCKVEGCDFCSKFKHSEDAFKDLQTRLWRCSYCSQEFIYYPTYKNHLKVHNNEMFACKFCNKAYLNIATLNIHMRNHTGETPFDCNVCGRKFKRKDSLKYHLTTHSDKRKVFRCDICDQGYTHTSSLFKHKRSAHSIVIDRTFVSCRLCDKKLEQKAYRVHMKTHGILVFKCRKCREYIEGEEEFETHKKSRCVPIERGTGKGSEEMVKQEIEENDEMMETITPKDTPF